MDCQSLNILTWDGSSTLENYWVGQQERKKVHDGDNNGVTGKPKVISQFDLKSSTGIHVPLPTRRTTTTTPPPPVGLVHVIHDSKSYHSSFHLIPYDTTASVRLIDFEYAGLNSRAADLANTFCEHCDMNNLKPDYEVQYPTVQEQDAFLIAYLWEIQPDLALFLGSSSSESSSRWKEFLDAMRSEIGKYTLLSHLGWAIWAIAQHYVSTIEYDYVAYAKVRIDGYELFKKKYWSLDR